LSIAPKDLKSGMIVSKNKKISSVIKWANQELTINALNPLHSKVKNLAGLSVGVI
jgi:hypothetical protein